MRSVMIIIVAVSFVIAASAAFVPSRIPRSADPGYHGHHHDHHHGYNGYNNNNNMGYGASPSSVAVASAGGQQGSFQGGGPSVWPGYSSLGSPLGNGPARAGAFGGSDSVANAQTQSFNGNGFSASASSASASSHSSGYGNPTSAVAQALTKGRK